MKNLSLVFVTAFALAAIGCKKPGGNCSEALDRSMELSKADMQKMPGVDNATLQKMKDLGVQHCKDDKWSDEALKCMLDSKTEADSRACYGKLSHEQQEKMNNAVMQMMTSLAGPGTAGSGASGSAGGAVGSPTGSAAAGSAMGAGDTGPGSAGSATAPK